MIGVVQDLGPSAFDSFTVFLFPGGSLKDSSFLKSGKEFFVLMNYRWRCGCSEEPELFAREALDISFIPDDMYYYTISE
jgi:hypothetical protein